MYHKTKEFDFIKCQENQPYSNQETTDFGLVLSANCIITLHESLKSVLQKNYTQSQSQYILLLRGLTNILCVQNDVTCTYLFINSFIYKFV